MRAHYEVRISSRQKAERERRRKAIDAPAHCFPLLRNIDFARERPLMACLMSFISSTDSGAIREIYYDARHI